MNDAQIELSEQIRSKQPSPELLNKTPPNPRKSIADSMVGICKDLSRRSLSSYPNSVPFTLKKKEGIQVMLHLNDIEKAAFDLAKRDPLAAYRYYKEEKAKTKSTNYSKPFLRLLNRMMQIAYSRSGCKDASLKHRITPTGELLDADPSECSTSNYEDERSGEQSSTPKAAVVIDQPEQPLKEHSAEVKKETPVDTTSTRAREPELPTQPSQPSVANRSNENAFKPAPVFDRPVNDEAVIEELKDKSVTRCEEQLKSIEAELSNYRSRPPKEQQAFVVGKLRKYVESKENADTLKTYLAKLGKAGRYRNTFSIGPVSVTFHPNETAPSKVITSTVPEAKRVRYRRVVKGITDNVNENVELLAPYDIHAISRSIESYMNEHIDRRLGSFSFNEIERSRLLSIIESALKRLNMELYSEVGKKKTLLTRAIELFK